MFVSYKVTQAQVYIKLFQCSFLVPDDVQDLGVISLAILGLAFCARLLLFFL